MFGRESRQIGPKEAALTDEEAYFDALVAADQRIEPRDWMPEA
jgi:ring-1,2-phenylacetyl-CoA epoxidase subunit PaaA